MVANRHSGRQLRSRFARAAVSWIALTLWGCGGQTDHADAPPGGDVAPAPSGPIMDREGFTVVAGASDPFAPLRQDTGDCGNVGYRAQREPAQATPDNPEGVLPMIDTVNCPFVTVSQPSLREIRAGERIDAAVFHSRLAAPEPAEAFIAVRVGDLDLIHERFDIDLPAPHEDCPSTIQQGYCQRSARVEGEVIVEQTLPEGTPLYFHAHNHGSNFYWLMDLGAAPVD